MRFRRRTDDEIPAEAVAHLPPTPGLEGLAAVRRDCSTTSKGPIRSTDPLPGKKVAQPMVAPTRQRGRRT